MTQKPFFFLYYVILAVVLVSQVVLAVGRFGSGVDDLAEYAQLQQQRSRLEIAKAQLQARHAQVQALTISATETAGYVAISQPLTITETTTTADQSLSATAWAE